VKTGYKPNWLYHGLLVGSLESACKILDSLSNGRLINRSLLREMKDVYELHFDIGNRPWKTPGYALGLMFDNTKGAISYGHTGMGPDSIICVYHFEDDNCTVAVSKEVKDQGEVEYDLIRIKNM